MSDDQLGFNFNPPHPTLPQLWTPDDIYNACDQRIVEQFKEDGRVERKRVEVGQKDLGDYLSMWANTQPHGGLVFIGVGNDGTVLGCKHCSTEHLNAIDAVKVYCPDASSESRRIEVVNSKGQPDFIIALRVYYRPDKLVECVDGNAYIREGDTKRRLAEAEKREMKLNRGELDFECERTILTFPDDFNAEVLEYYRAGFIEKRGLSDKPIEEVLELSKLGRRVGNHFEPNNACAILFAKDSRSIMPGAYIRVTRFNGPEEQFGHAMNKVADELFDGPLPLQVSRASDYIASQMRSFTRLSKDGKFVTRPEYPKSVWLEAVVNAAVHRSYNLKQMNIFVKMFDNKMVIESPGTFMPPTTATTVYDAHNPRNSNLMWGMYYFDYVQLGNEGTKRMRNDMEAAHLPAPVFQEKVTGVFKVIVTLKNDIEHRKEFVRTEAMPVIDPIVFETLTEDERVVVNWLAEGKSLNVGEAVAVLGKDWRSCKAVFDSLEKKFIISRPPGNDRDRHRKYTLRKRARR